MIARVLLLAVALVASASAGAAADPARYMDAKLVAEAVAPKPGSTILVGFRFTPKPGWHGYWSNPGDSGIAPTVRWTAPEGVSFGPLLHPAPTLIAAHGISSFVHEGPHTLLSRMTVARSLAPGTPIPIKADLRWAACTATQCVPLRATLTLDLVAGSGASGPDAALLRAAANKLPRAAKGATFAIENDRLQLRIPGSLNLDLGNTRFFPDETGYFSAAAAQSAIDDGAVELTAPLKGALPARLSGLVSDGRRSYRVTFVPAAAPHNADETDARQLPPEIKAPVSLAMDAIDAGPDARSASAPDIEPQPEGSSWLWLLVAAVMATAAAGWLWRRRRS